MEEEKQIPSIEIRICNTQPKSSIRNSSSRNLFKLNCPSTFVSQNASELSDKKKKFKLSATLWQDSSLFIYKMWSICINLLSCFQNPPIPEWCTSVSSQCAAFLDWPHGRCSTSGDSSRPRSSLNEQGNIGLLEKYLFNSNLFPKLRSYCGIGFCF